MRSPAVLTEVSCMSVSLKAMLVPCNRPCSSPSKSLTRCHSWLSSNIIQCCRIFAVPFNNLRHSCSDWSVLYIVNVSLTGIFYLLQHEAGRVTLEGCLSDDYYRVRELLYEQYAIVWMCSATTLNFSLCSSFIKNTRSATMDLADNKMCTVMICRSVTVCRCGILWSGSSIRYFECGRNVYNEDTETFQNITLLEQK
jgi:hypothetical protein